MAISFGSRIRQAWNAFFNKDPTNLKWQNLGPGNYYRPDRFHYSRGNERSIVTAVYNKIALDAATVDIRHVKLDDEGKFLNEMDTGLNSCLSIEANIDQTGRAFIQDTIQSMLDEGCVAMVATNIDDDPEENNAYRIEAMRTGRIVEWFPRAVLVNVYNEDIGRKQDVLIPKQAVAIVENPFYAVMNEPNSTLQRLIRKLNLLDAIDEKNSSGKLDLIIQLPYTVRHPLKKQQAEERRQEVEKQLVGSKYGIAYIDAAEHITQLNRPIENNLMTQIEYLTSMLYSQLGITQAILDGSADDKTMANYYSRTIEPILSAIVEEMRRKFLTPTARSQHQSIKFFREPFKLIPVSEIAELADKLTRNEIMTSNEIRQILGMRPAKDPEADKLRNKNLNQSTEDIEVNKQETIQKEENQNEEAL